MLSVGVIALSLPTFLPQSEFIMYLPIVREGHCAAHIGMDGIRIEKEPRQRDEYVNRIS